MTMQEMALEAKLNSAMQRISKLESELVETASQVQPVMRLLAAVVLSKGADKQIVLTGGDMKAAMAAKSALLGINDLPDGGVSLSLTEGERMPQGPMVQPVSAGALRGLPAMPGGQR